MYFYSNIIINSCIICCLVTPKHITSDSKFNVSASIGVRTPGMSMLATPGSSMVRTSLKVLLCTRNVCFSQLKKKKKTDYVYSMYVMLVLCIWHVISKKHLYWSVKLTLFWCLSLFFYVLILKIKLNEYFIKCSKCVCGFYLFNIIYFFC